jgi:hypothetical protein
MKWYLSFGAAALVAVSSAACNNSDTSTLTPMPVTSTTAPTPTATSTTETHTGTVPVGGADAYAFNVVTAGTVSITLTAAGPPANIIMGIGVGTPSGTVCTPISGASVTSAASNVAQLTGSASAGALCAIVFDIGNQTGPITYSITVVHT